MSKSINSIDYSINHPAVNGIIADLKIMVEKFHLEFTKLREIIQELAKRLDENKICKQEIICQAIKEILKEKVSEGKISERYIESCLPTEYKRKHIRKKIIETEQISVSQNKSISLIQNDESNKHHDYINLERDSEPQYNNNLTKTLPKLHHEEFEGCSLCKEVIAENKELREIAQKNIKFLSAELLNNGIKISKNKTKEIEEVSNRCKDFIYLIFNMEGNIITIKADIEIDKDTQENIIQANIIK
ncbi:MAG TPA: hypothetical protein VFC05_02385 [Nitrososphaeraceae archaeon]|nr:hypothetical protein [Nitrososphaeraceae archaeon]